MSNDAALCIWVPQYFIKQEDREESRNTKLTSFEDDIKVVQGII